MKKWNVLLACGLALTLAACGEQTNSSKTEDTTKTEQVAANEQSKEMNVMFKDALGNEHVFKEVPKNIATLNPGIMDILLQLGANVSGRPTISGDMTSEVKAIQELGNVHEPSVEQIVAAQPKVLVVPPSFQRFASSIEQTGTEIVYENLDSIEQIQHTISRYGEVFNATDKAEQLNADITKAAEEKVTSTKKALIVYGAPGTYLAALDTSLYGNILNTVGGNNIASDLPALDKYPTYASLSAEKIVEGNPEVIMLITHADPGIVQAGFEKQMSENAAWKNVDAVKNDNIIILPSELFDNPGTQIIDALDYMRDVLEKAEAKK